MVSSAEQQFREATSIARASGLDELTLHSMVTETYNAPKVNCAKPAPAAEHVYDELPEQLIDLPGAAKKYNCKMGYLRSMVQHGRIKTQGRIKAPARGGGYLLVNEAELRQLIENPRPVGRPKK